MFFILLFVSKSSFGHKDTALSRILRMPLDTNRVMALVDLGWKGHSNIPKTSVRYANFALYDSQRLKWKKGEALALLLKARSLDNLGEYKIALQLNLIAYNICYKSNFAIESARSLRQIGGMYQAMGDYSKALHFLEKSLSESKKLNYQKGIASALNDIGLVYRCLSEYDKAIACFLKSAEIKIRIGDLLNAAQTYKNIGLLYSENGDTKKAIYYNFKSLYMSQKLNNKQGVSANYCSIGNVYLLMRNFDKAKSYYQKSLQLNREIGDKISYSVQLTSIGIVCEEQNRLGEALNYLLAALDFQIQHGYKLLEGCTHASLSSVYEKQEKFELSKIHLKKSIKINNLLQNTDNLISNYINLSRIYCKQQNYNLSQIYLHKATHLVNANTSVLCKRDLYQVKSLLFEKIHQYQASIQAYKQYIVLRDSVLSLNNKTALALKEAKFEFDTKAHADSIKNVEIQKAKDLQLKLQHSELQKQKLKQTAMLSGIVVLMLLGWLLFSRYKAVNLQRISERKLLLLEKDQALVDERNRIADEMHDDVGADLSNLLLKIRMKERKQSALNTEDLGALKNSANAIIHKIDEIIWSLNAQRDTLNELLNFIQKYFDTLLKDNQLKGEFVCNNQIPNYPLSAQLRRNIFLTVKEILNNALKHSEASEVNMQVEFCNNKLKIQITDNGNGFEPSKIYNGNGILSIKKRILESNGTLDIQSKNGIGTNTTLEIELG